MNDTENQPIVEFTLVRLNKREETIALNAYADIGFSYMQPIITSCWFNGNKETEIQKVKERLNKCRKFGKLVCTHGQVIFDKYFSDLKED